MRAQPSFLCVSSAILRGCLLALSSAYEAYASNGFAPIYHNTVSPNATSAGGLMYDLHNTWGYQEEKATYAALLRLRPGTRPFLISRASFVGAGAVTGHWTGDNISKWLYLRAIVQGALQFSLYGIPSEPAFFPFPRVAAALMGRV